VWLISNWKNDIIFFSFERAGYLEMGAAQPKNYEANMEFIAGLITGFIVACVVGIALIHRWLDREEYFDSREWED